MRICIFFFLSLSLPALAEYRMLLLQITSADGTPGAQIKSNLDPDQYRGYHPLKTGESITYIDTWMCYGSTNEKPACVSPRDPASLAQQPANSTSPAVLETPAAAPPPQDTTAPATAPDVKTPP